MLKRSISLLALLAAALVAPTLAQEAQPTGAPMAKPAATPVPMPNAAEAKFIKQVQADLNKRFPTAAAGERAGYMRFGNEDSTGVISYANRQWVSTDPAHPSQLWYDVKGRLVGADFSVMQSSYASPPSLWGVDPSRWGKFGMHIHYGLAGPNGTTVYKATRVKTYQAAGGDPDHPDAAGLVKAGLAKSADEVKYAFVFPAIWDLQVWTLPNPAGAFAEKNSNLTPSASAEKDDM